MSVTRITQNMLYETTRSTLQRQTRRLLEAQEIVATQKRINALSDDPVGAGRVFNLESQLSQTRQFVRNINQGITSAEAYDASLSETIDILSRARELVLSQANTATTSDQTRESTAIELIAIREQLLNLANTRIGNSFIYAGHLNTAVSGADVALYSMNRKLATGKTDQSGRFAFPGLTTGIYEVVVPNGTGVYRVWAAKTAPPAAQSVALIVTTSYMPLGRLGLANVFRQLSTMRITGGNQELSDAVEPIIPSGDDDTWTSSKKKAA